jgi:hypothetical protein
MDSNNEPVPSQERGPVSYPVEILSCTFAIYSIYCLDRLRPFLQLLYNLIPGDADVAAVPLLAGVDVQPAVLGDEGLSGVQLFPRRRADRVKHALFLVLRPTFWPVISVVVTSGAVLEPLISIWLSSFPRREAAAIASLAMAAAWSCFMPSSHTVTLTLPTISLYIIHLLTILYA